MTNQDEIKNSKDKKEEILGENLINSDLDKISSSNSSSTVPLLKEKIKMIKLRSRIIPIIGMLIGLLVYFAWFIAIFFLIYGSVLIRTILTLLLIYQYTLATKSELYRKFLKIMRPWEVFNSYIVYPEEELKNDHSLFAFHPHGVMGFGASMSGALSEVLYHATFCGSRAMINMPVSGIIARWMGVHGVDNKNFKQLMKKGKNIIFLPGGFEEATITNYGKDRVFIKERKGFIKYALEHGYKIHPCYTFNENRIFYTFNYLEKFRLFLNKFKIPGTIFFSKYLVFPNCEIDLFTVIGKPLELPRIEHPTKEEVDRYHKIYIEELEGLYRRYKDLYGGSEELEVL